MLFKVVAFALPLGLDTLALAIALGLRGFRPWRPALLFTAFETVMPVFGIALARLVSERFQTAAAAAGGAILVGLGIQTLRHAFGGDEKAENVSLNSWRSMLAAGLAISTDELAAGFPLGASGLPIALVLITIGVQTMVMTLLGIAIGNRARAGLAANASRYAEIGAGVTFTLVGLWLIGPYALRLFR